MIARGDAADGAPARRRPYGGRELGARVLSGVVLAGGISVALVLGGWLFALIWLLPAILGSVEWLGMSRAEPARPLAAVTGAVLLALAVCAHGGAPLPAALAVGILGAAGLAVLARDRASRLSALAGLLGASILALVPPALRDAPAIGIVGPAWMFAVVWSTDVVAYFAGRTLGGPKLMPTVSPKKTWSGALGGLVGGTLAGTLVVLAARRHGWAGLGEVPLALVALASALASVVSQGGDLAESALKRARGVKDSGRLIPGHGGVMDRLDGFLAVAALVGLALVAHRLLAA